ncbi:DUF2804 domain-containing protein [Deltaproteobacteria bacterium TL4]
MSLYQIEIKQEDNLLDARGRLNHTGWARRPLLVYNRKQIAAPWYRIKEWEFYGVCFQQKRLEFFVADLGYFTLMGMVWHDFSEGKIKTWGGVKPFTHGAMRLSEDPVNGRFKGSCFPSGTISIRKSEEEHRIAIKTPLFKGLNVALVYQIDPSAEAMIVATGFKEHEHCFYYNYKKNMLAVEGNIVFEGKKYYLNPEESVGNFDWGRGVWPRNSHWYWGTGGGVVNKHKVWFNIGDGFGDLCNHTENMIFIDGKIHKTDRVTFKPSQKQSGIPWEFTSSDDRINLSLNAKTSIYKNFDIGLGMVCSKQIHGLFEGTLILNDGQTLKVKDMYGHAEDIRFRW